MLGYKDLRIISSLSLVLISALLPFVQYFRTKSNKTDFYPRDTRLILKLIKQGQQQSFICLKN